MAKSQSLSFDYDQTFPQPNGQLLNISQELQRLQIENHLLSNELEKLKDILEQQNIPFQNTQDNFALPATVIYRSPVSWNSSLWINVGKKDNKTLNRNIVMKNSPVIVGLSVVGVIDYVGESQSRVRLITDSGLTPAVRAARGDNTLQFASSQIEILKLYLKSIASESLSEEENNFYTLQLEILKQKLLPTGQHYLLAKGEVQGSSTPLWRSRGQILHGIGFNYDFSDDEGPARDLRTGKPVSQNLNDTIIPILQVNDLLVTTGMDGVFPPGLHVGIVQKIEMLKEGDYYYELEATPAAGNLNELKTLFIIPPIGYQPDPESFS